MKITEDRYYLLRSSFDELCKEWRDKNSRQYQSNFDIKELGIDLRIKAKISEYVYGGVFCDEVTEYLNSICPNGYYLFRTLNIALSYLTPGSGSITKELLERAREDITSDIILSAHENKGFDLPQKANAMWFFFYYFHRVLLIENANDHCRSIDDVFVKNPFIFGKENIYFDMSQTLDIKLIS